MNSKKASMFFQVAHTSLIFLPYFGQISFPTRISLDTMIFSTQRQPKNLTTQVIVVLFITTQRTCDSNLAQQNLACEKDGMNDLSSRIDHTLLHSFESPGWMLNLKINFTYIVENDICLPSWNAHWWLNITKMILYQQMSPGMYYFVMMEIGIL